MISVVEVRKKLEEIENTKFETSSGDFVGLNDLEIFEDDGDVFISSKDSEDYNIFSFKNKLDYAHLSAYYIIKDWLDTLDKEYYDEDKIIEINCNIKYTSNREWIKKILDGTSGFTALEWLTDLPEDDEKLNNENEYQDWYVIKDLLTFLNIDYSFVTQVIDILFDKAELYIVNDIIVFPGESTDGLEATGIGTIDDAVDKEAWAIQVYKDMQQFCEGLRE